MRTLGALWRSSHPGPSVVVSALALALGLSIGLEWWRLALLTVAVFAGQLSVGISNDAIDAPRDRAVGRAGKPLASGEVGLRTAWVAAFACLALALAVSAVLGWRMLAAHAFALGSAWAYNAGLKSTPASVLPFILSFGTFPSLATLSAADPHFAPAWAWIAGGCLGTAVHFTNVLPDLADDDRTGVRGLPHRLGVRTATIVASLALIAGAIAVLLGAAGGAVGAVSPLSWAFFGVVVVVAVFTALLTLRRAPTRTLFRLVMLAALLLAAQLVATGAALDG